MKLAALVLVLVTACQAGGGDDYPIGTGGGGPIATGGGGTGSGTGDAGLSDGITSLAGRVCLITDLRRLTVCSATGAKGLVVSLGTRTLTIGSDHDDGRFTIAVPPGTDLTWHVKSPTDQRIVTSMMPFSADTTIPVISAQAYTSLRALYGASLPVDQQGSVVVRVVRGGVPVTSVGASTSLAQNNGILYDGNLAITDDWKVTQTGGSGIVWFPGVSLLPSTAKVTLTPQGGTAVSTLVTVEDQAITFVTKDLP
jgi:hypothetical protein